MAESIDFVSRNLEPAIGRGLDFGGSNDAWRVGDRFLLASWKAMATSRSIPTLVSYSKNLFFGALSFYGCFIEARMFSIAT